MTGYGRGVAMGGGLKVEVEVSSVNRKQLDLLVNLPRPLALLESRVQEDIAQVVTRGRVTVDVAVHGAPGAHGAHIRIDRELAAAYVTSVRKTACELGIPDGLTVRHLLALPGVLHVATADENIELVWPVLRRALGKALAAYGRMRSREGVRLTVDLKRRVSLMERLVRRIRARAPGVVASHRKALRTRLATSLQEIPLPEERIEREIVVFADRIDITEELTRLESHFGQARQFFRSAEPAGKSLDFLAQEMYREINTIGSKANDAAIAADVVNFKTELERLREQVQNVE